MASFEAVLLVGGTPMLGAARRLRSTLESKAFWHTDLCALTQSEIIFLCQEISIQMLRRSEIAFRGIAEVSLDASSSEKPRWQSGCAWLRQIFGPSGAARRLDC